MILRVSLIWTACGLVIGQNDWFGNPYRSLNQLSGPFLPQPLKQLPASQPNEPYKASFPPIGQPQFPSNQPSPKVSQAGPPNRSYPYPYRQLPIHVPTIEVPSIEVPKPPVVPWDQIRQYVLDFIEPPDIVLFGNTYVKFKILENIEDRINNAIDKELKQESETPPTDILEKLVELVRPEMKKVAESIRDHIEDEKKKAEKWLNDSIRKWLSSKITTPIPLLEINGTVIVRVVEDYIEKNEDKVMDTKNELIQTVLAEALKPLNQNGHFASKPKPLFPWTGILH